MNLPLSIDNVCYYYNRSVSSILAGKCFSGDVVITNPVLYFVPHTIGKYAPASSQFGLAGAAVAAAEVTTTNQSHLHKTGMWDVRDTSETLQNKLDAYAADLRRQNRPDIPQLNRMAGLSWLPWMLFMARKSDVPCLLRFNAHEIQEPALSPTGVLTFEAQAATHTFKIGLTRKSAVRAAFLEALNVSL